MKYFPTVQFDDEKLNSEFQKLAEVIEALAEGYLPVRHAEPSKRVEGQIVYADGTDWNPGGTGKGVYVYDGTSWVKL